MWSYYSHVHYSCVLFSIRIKSLDSDRCGWNPKLEIVQIYIKDRYLEHFLWFCPQVNTRGPHWWLIKIGLGNSLVSLGNNPLPDLLLTQICHKIALLGYNELSSSSIISWSWWRHQMETLFALLAFCARNNSPHKGQWRGAFMLSLICAWNNSGAHNGDAGDFRRQHAYIDVTLMGITLPFARCNLFQCRHT